MITNYYLNKNRIILNAIASFLITMYFMVSDVNKNTAFIFLVISISHFIIYFKSRSITKVTLENNLEKNKIICNLLVLNIIALFTAILYENATSEKLNQLIYIFLAITTGIIFLIFNYKIFFCKESK